jgi:ketosteroid isomerase-like protein
MKLIVPIVLFALTCSHTLLAQEESPSVTAEEKTATTETASAAPSASPAATAAASEKKAAKSAAKAEQPAASPSAAPTTKKTSVEATLKENENRWETAFGSHDVSVAQAVVANDFVGVYWDGKTLTKSGIVSQVKKDKDTYQSARNEKLDVHRYAPDVAVVVGTAREKGTAKDGKPFNRTFRFTDTWVERNGQWQCVASQVMKLKG